MNSIRLLGVTALLVGAASCGRRVPAAKKDGVPPPEPTGAAEAPTVPPPAASEPNLRPKMPSPPVPPEYRARAAQLPRAGSLMDEYGVPSYPNQKHLCGQREFRPGGETLTWDAFATPDAPDRVRERLGARLGTRGFSEGEAFTGWRLPGPPARELELVPRGRTSAADRCPTKPDPDTETVIVVRRW